MAEIPKVLLLIESARTCERDFLRGVARYGHLHGPWAFSRKPKYYLKSNRSDISISQIENFDPDGIIVSDIEKIKEIAKLGKPTIIHTFKSDSYDMPTIIGNTLETGVMGAEHLLGLGFSQFAFCGLGNYYWSRGRYESFEKTIGNAGFKTDYYELDPKQFNKTMQKEIRKLSEWLSSLDKPIGLMTCADDCSQYVIEACKIADISVPEQIGLIGVDNDDMVCELSDPPLTSISLDFTKAGYDAAELLAHLMAGEEVETSTITVSPLQIQVRASTDILAIEDPDVAAAIKFIRNHSNQLIQIEDVMNEVTCCQRILHKKFKENLGRSVHQEIKRVRIERIASMLRETDLTISQIATRLGYFNINHISRYFQQAMGVAPLAYRKSFTQA